MALHSVATSVWEIFSMLFFLGRRVEQRGRLECPPQSPDLTPSDFFLWSRLNNTVSHETNNTADLKHKIACGTISLATNYVTLLPIVVNNAIVLVVEIIKIFKFKVTNTTISSHLPDLLCKRYVNKMYILFLEHLVCVLYLNCNSTHEYQETFRTIPPCGHSRIYSRAKQSLLCILWHAEIDGKCRRRNPFV
jgi:hypothetical protein